MAPSQFWLGTSAFAEKRTLINGGNIMAWVGKPLLRKEDFRFLTGTGEYVADLPIRAAHLVVLRSPHAAAEIMSIDCEAAKLMPGVLDIMVGQDIVALGVGGLPCAYPVTNRDGTQMVYPHHPVLALERVLHVGDQVAAVVADSLIEAQAASEAIKVKYKVLPSHTDLASSLDAGAKLVRSELPSNQCFDWGLGDEADVDEALRAAPHVVHLDLIQNRVNASPMETRGTVGLYDNGRDEYTLYTSNQNPHAIRACLAGSTLKIPEEKIRVVSPDVGGGFGMKIYHYAEEVLVLLAAKRVGRPVKWIASRSEAFLSDTYARDHVTKVSVGLRKDGVFTALKVHTIANLGAYLSTFGPSIPTFFYGNPFPGPYSVRQIFVNVKGVFTNTTPVDAYRGAGRPEMTYVMERIVEAAARELGLDPLEIRRKNIIGPEMIPYKSPFLHTIDSGDLPALLDKCRQLADLEGFKKRKRLSEKMGLKRGIGFAFYLESCGMGPSKLLMEQGFGTGYYEVATVRISPSGGVTVLTGSHSHGQGHETAFAQIVADRIGIDPANIEIVHGDTAKIPYGVGTYGSRSLSVGGSALALTTDKVIVKMKKIAAHMLQCKTNDVDLTDGIFYSRLTNRTLSFVEVAKRAYAPIDYPEDLEPGLEEITYYDPEAFTFPYGCHVVEVEVDTQTGMSKVCRYLAIDDFGKIINPLIVEGQLHGGAAQAIGQAKMESCEYDRESGQLLTGSFLDYAMPRALDIPNIETFSVETLCTTNPLGAKGCGEAAAIAGPPAVINAICNALTDFNVHHIDMPATPEKVWRAIQKAQGTSITPNIPSP
jgi:carbon-monoxide dehydrogenase large subunit